jgi:predicted secreted hydrolase
MKTGGTISAPWTNGERQVEGMSWFDHEFGSNQLSPEQEGWDWFSLRLDDGRAVMLYLIRRRDGTVEPASSGTVIYTDRSLLMVNRDTISVKVLDRWKSERSGASYPSRWKISLPEAGIELRLAALVPDQELVTSRSTGITYWEGVVAGEGLSSGREVKAEGYAELTGYAGSLGGLF